MLHGTTVTLRLVREADIDLLYERHLDIDNRGAFFPPGSHVRASLPGRIRGVRLLESG